MFFQQKGRCMKKIITLALLAITPVCFGTKTDTFKLSQKEAAAALYAINKLLCADAPRKHLVSKYGPVLKKIYSELDYQEDLGFCSEWPQHTKEDLLAHLDEYDFGKQEFKQFKKDHGL